MLSPNCYFSLFINLFQIFISQHLEQMKRQNLGLSMSLGGLGGVEKLTTKTSSASHSYQRLLLFAELKTILQAVLSMVVFEESSRAKKSICNLWKVVYELLHHVLVM